MKKSNVMVEFIIVGDKLIPDVVTEKLQIYPDQFWIEGDDIEGKSMKRKDTYWILSTGYEESHDINFQLSKVVETIKEKKYKLKELRNEYDVEYFFAIVVNIEE